MVVFSFAGFIAHLIFFVAGLLGIFLTPLFLAKQHPDAPVAVPIRWLATHFSHGTAIFLYSVVAFSIVGTLTYAIVVFDSLRYDVPGRARLSRAGRPVVNAFRETFRRTMEELAAEYRLEPLWTQGDNRDIVSISKPRPDGFAVRLECFDYGVYPFIEGWHGAPWDVTIWEPEQLAQSLREFISSVLTDAVLLVYESNGTPYKWVLERQFEGERVCDKTGLFVFNWFGKRGQRKYSNVPPMA